MNTQLRRLRPLSITDILDETVDLYKTNFPLLVGISAVLYVPYTMISSYLPQPGRFNPDSIDPNAMIGTMAPFAILGILFYLLINPIVTGALTLAISDRYLGRSTTITDCYKRVAKPGIVIGLLSATIRVFLLTLLSLLPSLILIGFGGALLSGMRSTFSIPIGVILIIAGVCSFALPILVGLRLALVSPIFFIESVGAKRSVSRSWFLGRGNALKVFGLLLISGLVIGMIQGLVTAPTSFLAAKSAIGGGEPAFWVITLHAILNSVVTALLMPISSIVLILLYYDIRIRKEGFDLELLANELDHKTREMSAHDVTSLPQEQISQPEHSTTTDEKQ